MQNRWIWRATLQADAEQRPSDAHVQDAQRVSCCRALFKLGSKLIYTPISPVTLHAGKLQSLKNRQIKEKRQRVTTFWKWEHGFDKCKSLFFYLILKVTWEHHRKTQIWGTLPSLWFALVNLSLSSLWFSSCLPPFTSPFPFSPPSSSSSFLPAFLYYIFFF